MEHTAPRPLLVQRLARWASGCYETCRLPFWASMIWGLLAYTFAFTNKLLNHDEAGQLFGKGATVSSGRWGLSILDNLLPNFSMPWIYGILTVFLIALSICIIVRLFAIQSRLVQVVLAGSIMVFPSLIGLFGYMFTSSAYAVSFLCAVAAVWCIRQKPLLFALPALALMGFSLSIYQSYLSVTAGLLVVLLIQDLLQGEKAMPVIKRGLWYVAFLLTALAGYYIATQLLLKLLGIGFNDYASENVTFRVSELPQKIGLAYVRFLRFFTWRQQALIPTGFSARVHGVLALACCTLGLLWLLGQKKADAGRVLLLLALVALLPLAIHCMYLITDPTSIHTLVLYGFVCLYVLAAVLLDFSLSSESPQGFKQLLSRVALNLGIVALALIVIINTYVANEAFLNLHLRYENSYAFYTSLLADLRSNPEFQEGTKLAVVGSYDSPDFYEYYFRFLPELTGVMGFLPDSYSYGAFMHYYLGLSIPIATAEEAQQIMATEEYQNMNVYPYYGSTKVINDILVVKLS